MTDVLSTKVKAAVSKYLIALVAAQASGDEGEGYAEKGSYFSTLDNLPDFVAAEVALSLPITAEPGEMVAYTAPHSVERLGRDKDPFSIVVAKSQIGHLTVPLYARPQGKEVKVNPLEWEQGEAQCAFGLYSVHNITPLKWSVRFNGTALGTYGITEAMAQGQAQADLNARVRSTLTEGSSR